MENTRRVIVFTLAFSLTNNQALCVFVHIEIKWSKHETAVHCTMALRCQLVARKLAFYEKALEERYLVHYHERSHEGEIRLSKKYFDVVKVLYIVYVYFRIAIIEEL